jgi:hypothetical protein
METHDALGEINQPAQLPLCLLSNVFWYHVFLTAPGVEVCADEPYRKQTLRNRFEIASSFGRIALTVPVRLDGSKPVMQSEVELVWSQKQRLQTWRTLVACYGSAPFFINYADIVEPFFFGAEKTLLELNMAGHLMLKQCLPELPDIFLNDKQTKGPMADFTGMFKTSKTEWTAPAYSMVFENRTGFLPNLSLLDVLMHLGPETLGYVKGLK